MEHLSICFSRAVGDVTAFVGLMPWALRALLMARDTLPEFANAGSSRIMEPWCASRPGIARPDMMAAGRV